MNQRKSNSKDALPPIYLIPVDTKNPEELEWLYSFIHNYHSAPDFILPNKAELMWPGRHFFRAVYYLKDLEEKDVASKQTSALSNSNDDYILVGISGYEVLTPHLVETQKTIVTKDERGKGWGRKISLAIEKEVENAGFHKIRTCIYTSNLAMLTIKLHQGYVIEGYHRDHDGPGLHEYSLGKIIGKLST